MSTLSRKLDFDKLHNFRDLGGMRSEDGSDIKSGCLFRAGHLSEDIKDLKKNYLVGGFQR